MWVISRAELAFTLKFRVRVNDESGSWVEEEFEALDLGDPRRDRRAKALLKRLAAKPTVASVIAGALPLYGTCTMSILAIIFNCSPAI